jgi:hypothetical protein
MTQKVTAKKSPQTDILVLYWKTLQLNHFPSAIRLYDKRVLKGLLFVTKYFSLKSFIVAASLQRSTVLRVR